MIKLFVAAGRLSLGSRLILWGISVITPMLSDETRGKFVTALDSFADDCQRIAEASRAQNRR
jgi:hypothetical protein